MEVGGIGLGEFCVIAGRIFSVEVELLNMGGKLEKMNKAYRFCSAPEIVAGLEAISAKLAQTETEMRLMITSVRSDVKASELLEAFEPVLAVAEEIIPHRDRMKEKQRLLADARKCSGLMCSYRE